ncbi:hypothetical protein K469DRAFT_789726, partial [Zopfia rhizophila CBS 207.26]
MASFIAAGSLPPANHHALSVDICALSILFATAPDSKTHRRLDATKATAILFLGRRSCRSCDASPRMSHHLRQPSEFALLSASLSDPLFSALKNLAIFAVNKTSAPDRFDSRKRMLDSQAWSCSPSWTFGIELDIVASIPPWIRKPNLNRHSR